MGTWHKTLLLNKKPQQPSPVKGRPQGVLSATGDAMKIANDHGTTRSISPVGDGVGAAESALMDRAGTVVFQTDSSDPRLAKLSTTPALPDVRIQGPALL